MGMIMDLIHSFTDMKSLSKLQNTIQEEVDKLEKEGKLPDELKAAFNKLKEGTSSSDGKSSSVESTVEPLKEFVATLEKYENLFPDNIKSVVEKFETVTKDLDGIASRMDNLGKK